MSLPNFFKYRLSVTGFVMLIIALLTILFSCYIVLTKYNRFNDDMDQLRIVSIKNKEVLLQKEISRAVDFIKYKQNQTNIRLKKDLRANIDLTYSMIAGIYHQ